MIKYNKKINDDNKEIEKYLTGVRYRDHVSVALRYLIHTGCEGY
jgi:hypothetical protein